MIQLIGIASLMTGTVLVVYQLVLQFSPLGYQYLYVGKTSGERIFKIGISGNPKIRESFINKSIKGSREKIVFHAPTYLAYPIEQWLHAMYRTRRKIYKGSGKTEWFRLSLLHRALVMGFIILASILSQLLTICIGIFIAYQIATHIP